jgi:hypothetical protein
MRCSGISPQKNGDARRHTRGHAHLRMAFEVSEVQCVGRLEQIGHRLAIAATNRAIRRCGLACAISHVFAVDLAVGASISCSRVKASS